MDPKTFKRLVEAEEAFESGRLSRREFNKILASTTAAAGVSLAGMNPAFAWVATHMRKRRGSSGSSGASPVTNSCRLVAGNYFTRTPSVAGNQQKFTFSCWVKRGKFSGASDELFSCLNGAASHFCFTGTGAFGGNQDVMMLHVNNAEVYRGNAFYRDPAAWYHVVLSVDTTQAVTSERIRVFINGVREGYSSNSISQNASTPFNSQVRHTIGDAAGYEGTGYGMTGLLSEVYWIDGQALTPTSFAQTDTTTGAWSAKQYSGAFGTNGFYIHFKSNSAASGSGTASGSYPNVTGVSGLGADYSGNNNHYAATGVATTDQILDCPTNNYCTLNPLYSFGSTIQNSNFDVVAGNNASVRSTMELKGKVYYEVTVVSDGGAGSTLVGVVNGSLNHGTNDIASSNAWCYSGGSGGTGNIVNGNYPGSAYGSDFTTNDVIGVAVDTTASKIWFSKNGTWQNSGAPASGTNPAASNLSGTLFAGFSHTTSFGSSTLSFNFGQGGRSGLAYDSASGGSFKYTPPSGFKAVSSANISTPAIVKPSQYFTAATYVGNGASQRIGGVIPMTPGYTIARSLRFQTGNSTYLSRSLASSGNRTTWTWSGWLKRGKISQNMIFSSGDFGSGSSPFTYFTFNSAGNLYFFNYNGSDYTSGLGTTLAAFNDASVWYHVVLVYDSSNGTAVDRIRIYVNGVRQTMDFSSSPYQTPTSGALSAAWNNNAFTQGIGQYQNWAGAPYFDGSMAEVNFVDGQALAPTDFGQADSTSGDWFAKQYSGTYGTNGFYLNFSDNSNTTAATLGKDWSGNGNNWTPNAFATTDSVIDTPTKNFCVLNPLDNGGHVLSSGNLKMAGPGSYKLTRATIPITSGKWYWEAKYSLGSTGGAGTGIATAAAPLGNYIESSVYGWSYNQNDGNAGTNAAYFSYGSSYTTSGDVVGVAFDADSGTLAFYKNGVSQGAAFTTLTSGPYYPAATTYYANASFEFNFGQGGQSGLTYDSASGGSFKYTPPSGYKALCVPNLPAVSSSVLQSTPDLVWIKDRTSSNDHAIYDSVRGVMQEWSSNTYTTEATQATGLAALTKTGFTIGALSKMNTSGNKYAAWMWKKGVSPGFDIVTYSGTGSTQSIAHSLGTTPAFIITKNRAGGSEYAVVYHQTFGATNYTKLGTTNGNDTGGSTFWPSAPTSSVFTVGSDSGTGGNSKTYVAYLWAEVAGFSKFGSYTGNGNSGGPFIWCGFRPAYICVKKTSATGAWVVVDTLRSPANSTDLTLTMNTGDAETTGDGGNWGLDILSNGFKIRGTNSDFNTSGGTYIFMAFAEAPFKYANAR